MHVEERTDARQDTSRRLGLLASACAGCANEVNVLVADRAVEGPGGTRGAITYADTDIAVWDCPDCGFTNADVLAEP